MSAATVQAMFHKFCEHFAKEMYDEHTHLPTEKNGELDHVMRQYDRLGFTGAMGSMGVTHIGWSRCPYNQARLYTGKEGVPTVGYQVTVNHAGRAVAVTEGFTGSTNDKTIIWWEWIRFGTTSSTRRRPSTCTTRTARLERSRVAIYSSTTSTTR